MLKLLSRKEAKEIIGMIVSQFDCEFPRVQLLMSVGRKKRVYIFTGKSIPEIERIFKVGLYIGTLEREGFRPSIEGAHIIARTAKKNVVELEEEKAVQWMLGNDIILDRDVEGPYVIVKHGSFVLGAGKLKGKKLLNYIPKERRLEFKWVGE